MQTAMEKVTLESGAERPQGEAMTGRGDTVKSPSAAAKKLGARGRHGARPAQRGNSGVRR